MKGVWKVASNFIFDEKQYIVYRILNTSETDHSGNREYLGTYVADRAEAQKVVDILNGEAEKC